LQKGKAIKVEQNLSDSFTEDLDGEHYFDSLAKDSEDNVHSRREDDSYDIDEATKEKNLDLCQRLVDMNRRRSHPA
jgi:hypothetical protein